MITKYRLIALALAIIPTLLPQLAAACPGPGAEDYHLPSCTIPEPAPGEVVSVVSATGWFPSASVHVGAPLAATAFATIKVKPSDMRHYLVLTSASQIIWNIEGDTDSISRVIVLGASGLGPWAAGVIGIPKEKIIFTEPDLSALDVVQQTSCTRMSYACSSAQWFGDRPSGRATFHPAPTQRRMQADAFVEPPRGFGETPEWPVAFPEPEFDDTPVPVDPSLVISPRPAVPYDQPTGQAGLDALVAAGALLAPGDPGFDAALGAYAKAFSARYRSRFYPDFLFVPQVDYVVTRAITLPVDSPSNIYLLAGGVPLPGMNGNRDYRTCFLDLDQAGEPAGPERFDGPFCRDDSLGMPEPDSEIFLSAQRADNLERGQDCRLMDLPEGTRILVLDVTETGQARYAEDPPREISVALKGDGPTVLYLHTNSGPVRWVLTGDGIVQVFFLRPLDFQPEATRNGGTVAQARLGLDREGCPWFPPYHLNAPGLVHLDQMMQVLLGQPIDQVVKSQIGGNGPVRIVIGQGD
jgi:hypothetical protein